MSKDKTVDVEDTSSSGSAAGSAGKLDRQEQNWKLMTVLQIPWHHANRIEDKADRDFLLTKAKEVEGFLQMQQQQQMQHEQQPPSSIITPN